MAEHEAHADEGMEDIRKLSPEERIARLKELEEARKKEIEEAEALIKETVLELEAEEKKKIPIPEAKATDLSTVETIEGKQIVATHHFLATGSENATLPLPQQQRQEKTLEEVAAEAPTQQTQQHQPFQKPAYAIGTEPQRSAFGEYVSGSQRTVTGGAGAPGSEIEDKVTEFYKSKAVTGGEPGDPQQRYFGTGEQVTGGYETRKTEEEQRQSFYESQRKRGGGPA